MSRKTAPLLLVFLLPLLLFSSNLDGTWILDDHYQAEENPYIRSIRHLPRIFTTRLWKSTSVEQEGSDIFRPVFLASYQADYHLFGLWPPGFHLVNNLLHSVNALLLFLLARRFLPPLVAVAAALLFGIHPIVVEGVSWIGGRMDLLVTFFALSNILLALRILDRPTGGGSPLAFLLFGLTVPLGIFSKETFVAVPFASVAALAVFSPGRRCRLATLFGLLTALTAASLWLRQQVVPKEILSLVSLDNLKNAGALLSRFFHLLFVPADSDFFFPFEYAPFAWQSDLWLPVLFAVLIGAAIVAERRNRGFLLGLALFLAPLVPVALIIDLLGLLSERYFYLPMAGCSLAVAAFLEPRSRAVNRRVVLTGLALCFVSLAAVTWLRNREWRDEVRLYTASALRDPGNFRPHFFLAWHYMREGERDLEIRSYRECLRRKPDHLQALNNLGVHLTDRGDFAEAEAALGRAYGLEPKRAKTSYNFGYLYERQGRAAEAALWYRRALDLDGNYSLARGALERVTRATRS